MVAGMEHHEQLLRLALRIDAIVSAAFGLLVLLGSPILPELLGPPNALFWVVGVGVLIYAGARADQLRDGLVGRRIEPGVGDRQRGRGGAGVVAAYWTRHCLRAAPGGGSRGARGPAVRRTAPRHGLGQSGVYHGAREGNTLHMTHAPT